jgi:anti-anti-sigma regulatory factor
MGAADPALARCHGFSVTAGGRRIGVVETPVFPTAAGDPDYLIVRTTAAVPGTFRVAPVAAVAAVDPAGHELALDLTWEDASALPERLPLDEAGAEPPAAVAEYRCRSCDYLAADAVPPDCPRCRGTTWIATARSAGRDIVVTRLASALYLIAPPPAVDEEAGVALATTVAHLPHARPSLVLDLTQVAYVDGRAAELILALAERARADGGQVLLASAGTAASFELRELDPADAASTGLDGPLGRALGQLAGAKRR